MIFWVVIRKKKKKKAVICKKENKNKFKAVIRKTLNLKTIIRELPRVILYRPSLRWIGSKAGP